MSIKALGDLVRARPFEERLGFTELGRAYATMRSGSPDKQPENALRLLQSVADGSMPLDPALYGRAINPFSPVVDHTVIDHLYDIAKNNPLARTVWADAVARALREIPSPAFLIASGADAALGAGFFIDPHGPRRT